MADGIDSINYIALYEMERENVRHTRKMAKLTPYRHTRKKFEIRNLMADEKTRHEDALKEVPHLDRMAYLASVLPPESDAHLLDLSKKEQAHILNVGIQALDTVLRMPMQNQTFFRHFDNVFKAAVLQEVAGYGSTLFDAVEEELRWGKKDPPFFEALLDHWAQCIFKIDSLSFSALSYARRVNAINMVALLERYEFRSSCENDAVTGDVQRGILFENERHDRLKNDMGSYEEKKRHEEALKDPAHLGAMMRLIDRRPDADNYYLLLNRDEQADIFKKAHESAELLKGELTDPEFYKHLGVLFKACVCEEVLKKKRVFFPIFKRILENENKTPGRMPALAARWSECRFVNKPYGMMMEGGQDDTAYLVDDYVQTSAIVYAARAQAENVAKLLLGYGFKPTGELTKKNEIETRQKAMLERFEVVMAEEYKKRKHEIEGRDQDKLELLDRYLANINKINDLSMKTFVQSYPSEDRAQLMDSIFGRRYVNQANPQKQNTHPLPMDIGSLISDYVGVRKNVTLRGGKRSRRK
jgi:hypothetical protein